MLCLCTSVEMYIKIEMIKAMISLPDLELLALHYYRLSALQVLHTQNHKALCPGNNNNNNNNNNNRIIWLLN